MFWPVDASCYGMIPYQASEKRSHTTKLLERWFGPFCVIVMVTLISLMLTFLCFTKHDNRANQVLFPLYMLLVFISICCLGLVSCIDPGSVNFISNEESVVSDNCESNKLLAGSNEEVNSDIVLEKEITDKKGRLQIWTWCQKCKLWRPPRASHCKWCERCFLRLDHHCAVTGNCIGQNNLRFFTAFLIVFGLGWLVGTVAAVFRLYYTFYYGYQRMVWELVVLSLFVIISICHVPMVLGAGLFYGLNGVFDCVELNVRESSRKRREQERNIWQNFKDIYFAPIRIKR